MKDQISKHNYVWYYDPFINKIEWISLQEILKNIVTENLLEILDPCRVICGCGLVISQEDHFVVSDNLYTENILPICRDEEKQWEGTKLTNQKIRECNFFHEKSKKKMKPVKIKNSFNSQRINKQSKQRKTRSLKRKKQKSSKNYRSKLSKVPKSVETKRKLKDQPSKIRSKSFRISNVKEVIKNKDLYKKISNSNKKMLFCWII